MLAFKNANVIDGTGSAPVSGATVTKALRRSRDIRVKQARNRGPGSRLAPMSVTDPAPRGRHRIRRPRITFATRLLLGGFTLSLGIITAVSAFLLVSRDQQTQVGAQTNAQSRAQAYRELLQQVAAPQARFAAQDVAGLPSMAAALQTTPASPEAVAALLSGPTKVITDLPDETVSVFNIDGTLLATTEAAGTPQVSSGLELVRAALLGSPAEAIDFVTPQMPFYDFAAPVIAQGTPQVLGAFGRPAATIRSIA